MYYIVITFQQIFPPTKILELKTVNKSKISLKFYQIYCVSEKQLCQQQLVDSFQVDILLFNCIKV